MRGWWWWAVLAAVAGAFNLEPRLAVVKRGRPGSYFGYSVAQHQIVGDRHVGHHTEICTVEVAVDKFAICITKLVFMGTHPLNFILVVKQN